MKLLGMRNHFIVFCDYQEIKKNFNYRMLVSEIMRYGSSYSQESNGRMMDNIKARKCGGKYVCIPFSLLRILVIWLLPFWSTAFSQIDRLQNLFFLSPGLILWVTFIEPLMAGTQTHQHHDKHNFINIYFQFHISSMEWYNVEKTTSKIYLITT